MLGTKMEEIF
jgi:hypothetical protein